MNAKLSPRVALGAFLAVLAVAPLVLSPFSVTLLNYIGLYAMVSLGLVLLTGVGGLTSFGQAAFVGLGAYTTAALTTLPSLPGWLAWIGASPWLTLLAGLLEGKGRAALGPSAWMIFISLVAFFVFAPPDSTTSVTHLKPIQQPE